MSLQNRCQLITYPDSLGRNLAELSEFLERVCGGAVHGLHLLPFYPSSGDRGFAPLRYDQVDPAYGSWADVDALGKRYDLIVDFMINHLSRRSAWFEDFLAKGDASEWADLFIRFSRLAAGGHVSQADLAKVFKRKPTPPYVDVQLPGGRSEKVWCTFSDEQIDLNLQSPAGRRLVDDFLKELAAHRIRMLRLDAFAYVVKRLGTNCFFVEPDTSELLRQVAEQLAAGGVEVLPEIHERHTVQLMLAAQGYWVYDFNLPLLVLQAFYDGDGTNLAAWLKQCPHKQVTTLDTHDGLPVLDVAGLMSAEDLERTKQNLFAVGANVQRYSLDPEFKNRNVYQLNCTYYSALGEDDQSYLAARALQFFAPGIPQVYYVGLLAGRNDVELAERTRFGRNVNRHNYSLNEALLEAQRPVVQRLLGLMRFRSECPAFGGTFAAENPRPSELVLRWRNGRCEAMLEIDLGARQAHISYRANGGWRIYEP